MHEHKENETDRQFIGISEDRLKHILGVSRKAYRIAKDRGHDEKFARKMFMAGWLHDVGYEFSTGKLYNCDLNASYNIGARYFIREITKSLPATVKQRLEAKVPSAVKRSTCTLSTLISFHAVLYATA
jgi:HD superfamily phosphodiesterase